MTWSPAFRNALERNAPRRHRVRSLPGPASLNPAPDWTLTADHSSLGVALALSGETAGARLSVPGWESTIGGFSADLVGDPRPLMQRIWRGQLVVHEVTYEGMTAWEPVQLGVVDELTNDDHGRCSLRCLDITAGLKTRYTTSARELALFAIYGLTEEESETGLNLSETGWGTLGTRTNEQYDPGNEATLTVLDGTHVTGDTGTTQGRLVCIDPTAANRFFVRYTGTSATTLTGCTDNVYGTIARLKASGQVCQTVPFIEDHPLDILRKVFVSNGRSSDTPSAPANGVWNTLPRTWGYGIPDYLIDHDDIEQWKPRLSPSSGASDWTMLSELEQPDGWAYLSSFFQRAGIIITMRQGRITCRGVTDPAGTTQASSTAGMLMGRLTGEDIVPGSLRWTAWGGAGAVEYNEVRVFTANGNFGTADDPSAAASARRTVRSHPSEGSYIVPMQDAIWSNEGAHRALIRARLEPWVLTLCERLDVELANPLARGLAIGDVVLLDLPHFGGRDWPQVGTYRDRAAMVVGVDPDWWGDGATKVVMASPPPLWWVS